MKNLVPVTLVALLASGTVAAQKNAVQTDTISTPTVQCNMCKSRIEEYIKKIDGVTYVNVQVKKKNAVVKYLKDRTNGEMIKASIANAGYDANEISANPDSYKLLPKCCKKPEENR